MIRDAVSIQADFGEPIPWCKETIYKVKDENGKPLTGYHLTKYRNYYDVGEMAHKFQQHCVSLTKTARLGTLPAIVGPRNAWLWPKVVIDDMTTNQIAKAVRDAENEIEGPYTNE